MRLFRVILPVRNIEEATAFYGAVLGEPGRRVSKGRHYFGGDDGAILACYEPGADGDPVDDGWKHHAQQFVYFAVEDLERAKVACEAAGATDITPISKMPWGETMFWALDPFGNPISFVQSGTEFTG